jgi:hypothetical protein
VSKRCNARKQSDNGMERCEGHQGHRFHYYSAWITKRDWAWRIFWPNRNWRRAAGEPSREEGKHGS